MDDTQKPLKGEATVEGIPLTVEHRIIAALVKKLGGEVVIERSELTAIEGLEMAGELSAHLELRA